MNEHAADAYRACLVIASARHKCWPRYAINIVDAECISLYLDASYDINNLYAVQSALAQWAAKPELTAEEKATARDVIDVMQKQLDEFKERVS